MIVRASLCALDWNYNVGRPQKLDEYGKPLYREKVRMIVNLLWYCFKCVFKVDRSSKNRNVVPVLVPKDTSWQDKIFTLCVKSMENDTIPNPKVRMKLSHWFRFTCFPLVPCRGTDIEESSRLF